MTEHLKPTWHGALIVSGLVTIALGFFWPKPGRVPKAVSAIGSASASATPKREWWRAQRWRPEPIQMTYCPGPDCRVAEKARRACEEREPRGEFSAEPDFVCKFHGDVHRMVCDDVDDEHQCGMMSHSDLAYAREELRQYAQKAATVFKQVDFDADAREGKLRCIESAREVECEFTQRSTGLTHPDSPIVCNWMGCGFPLAASAD